MFWFPELSLLEIFDLVCTQSFPKNLHFLPPETHMSVWKDSFSEDFADVLNEWSFTKRQSASDNGVKLKVRLENQI